MDKQQTHRLAPVLLVAVLAAGAVLRLTHLNLHSLDLDETMSVWLAQKPTLELIRNTLNLAWDPHPPGYYLMLKGWMALAGSGEGAVRLLSALFGILMIGLLYLVGEHLFDRWTGLIAAGLGAINPLLVWLSQEVRMYMPAVTLALGSIYCLIRALDKSVWYWWLGYALLALAACYSHLFASLLLPVAVVYILIRGWRSRIQWLWGALAVGAVAFLYLPFAINAWSAGQAAPEINVYPRLELGEQIYTLLQSFTVRFLLNTPDWLWVPLLLLAAVVILGLWPEEEQPDRPPRIAWVLLLAWLVIPLVAFLWINARRPAFNPKYMAVITPALWLAAASGIISLGRWRTWLVIPALIPILLLAGLGWRYVWNEAVLREDWRTAAGYVAEHATAADQVLVHLHYARVPFEYYYDGQAEVVAPLGSRPPAPEDLDELLSPYSQADVLWLVQAQEHYTDPQHVIERWFAERGPIVTEQYPTGMSIKAYALGYRLSSLPEAVQLAQVGFGSRLHLVGYQLDQTHLRPDSTRLHPPSNWIHLTLYWQVDQPLEGELRTFVEMTDDQGGIWGGKLDQSHNVLNVYPPSLWQPGEVIRDDYDLNLNPVTPAGTYHIRVGVQGTADGLFWPVSGAAESEGRAVLTDVQIGQE